eukprot:3127894-Prorocentrum_lima.AAC.1
MPRSTTAGSSASRPPLDNASRSSWVISADVEVVCVSFQLCIALYVPPPQTRRNLESVARIWQVWVVDEVF